MWILKTKRRTKMKILKKINIQIKDKKKNPKKVSERIISEWKWRTCVEKKKEGKNNETIKMRMKKNKKIIEKEIT